MLKMSTCTCNVRSKLNELAVIQIQSRQDEGRGTLSMDAALSTRAKLLTPIQYLQSLLSASHSGFTRAFAEALTVLLGHSEADYANKRR